MKNLGVVLTLIGASLVASLAADDKPQATFDAVAEVKSSQGTRSMPVSITVNRPMSLDEADFYRHALRDGGQEALISAIRGSDRGRLMLGAMEFPLDVVVAERVGDGWKYTIVTTRWMRFDEAQSSEASRDYPFSVAIFEVPDSRRGEGTLTPRAALSITDDGRINVKSYEGATGRLKDMRRR